MKIAVASTGGSLDGQVAEQFGRCRYFLIVDTESMKFEAMSNPASGMPGGAGPAAVQAIAQKNVSAIFVGKIGPKAQDALDAANIKFIPATGDVRQAIETAKNNHELPS